MRSERGLDISRVTGGAGHTEAEMGTQVEWVKRNISHLYSIDQDRKYKSFISDVLGEQEIKYKSFIFCYTGDLEQGRSVATGVKYKSFIFLLKELQGIQEKGVHWEKYKSLIFCLSGSSGAGTSRGNINHLYSLLSMTGHRFTVDIQGYRKTVENIPEKINNDRYTPLIDTVRSVS